MSLTVVAFLCVATTFGAVLQQVGRIYIPDSGITGAENIAIDIDIDRIFAADGENLGLNVIDFEISSDDDDDDNTVSLSYVETMYFTSQDFLDFGHENITIEDVTSVEYNSMKGYLVACIVPTDYALRNGYVAIVDPIELKLTNLVELDGCFLPDHVYITNHGNLLVISCEGEPDDNTVETPAYNPPGSIMLVDVSDSNVDATKWVFTNLGFTDYNQGGSKYSQLPQDIYLPYSAASVAENIEPEYSVCDDDFAFCYVSLQENNAVAVVDIVAKEIVGIYGLGMGDFSEYGLDASDKDGGINIDTYPNLYGMRMPDNIQYFQTENGREYVVTANEGDSKKFDESRVGDLVLNESSFGNVTHLQQREILGRLKVNNQLGFATNTDATFSSPADASYTVQDGSYDKLYAFSSRDFTIFEVIHDKTGSTAPVIEEVFSSKGDFEAIIAEQYGECGAFNCDASTPSFDSRSDDKGPEPESVAIGACNNGQIYIFIGLERVGGVMVYDATFIDDGIVSFVEYVNNRDWNVTVPKDTRAPEEAGDFGPEQMRFVPENVYGTAYLMVANADSASVTAYTVDCGEPVLTPIRDSANTIAYVQGFMLLMAFYLLCA
eukprot:CAMPEP_0197074234 /NCGR_PEP_ID=MMETSP1384-20130603/211006_1 /TAXON_ID=29189 /ORGANISM="Ammonia sp." /LENGTH=606 /DNA_ID=CAMNT_0042513075 /DNA_START=51 /DNA_END=1871 /DNA_ORIENTATION=+